MKLIEPIEPFKPPSKSVSSGSQGGGVHYTSNLYFHWRILYKGKTFYDRLSMNDYLFIEVKKMLSLEYVQASLVWIGSFAQAIDLSGFNDILFLFMGLGTIALAIGVSLVVVIVVLDILGIDILGLASTIKRG